MHSCVCGKFFENRISCSRHKSTCSVYKKGLIVPIKEFLQEGVDHVICAYCGYKARDLGRHLATVFSPHPNLEEYKKTYPESKLICSDVDKKRRETCELVHGDPNYRNKSLQSQRIREVFESDPSIMERVRATKLELYGNPTYVNVEKRIQTIKEKYGVDNPMKNPEIAKRSLETRKRLYGDNPIQRPPVFEKDVLESLYNQNKTLREIAGILNTKEEVISYWMKKHNIKVIKKIVIPKNKEYVKPELIVKEYLEYCAEQSRFFSFGEYGKNTMELKGQRLKRLFNIGKKYHYLYEQLKQVAGQSEKISEFLILMNLKEEKK